MPAIGAMSRDKLNFKSRSKAALIAALTLISTQPRIVFDGSIDNREELAASLGHRPGQAEPAGDSALAAELWFRFGEDGLARIGGQFALALWDGPGRRLDDVRHR